MGFAVQTLQRLPEFVPTVTGIGDSNKSRVRQHRSLKLASKLEYLSIRIKALNYFLKKLHLRCLTGFWRLFSSTILNFILTGVLRVYFYRQRESWNWSHNLNAFITVATTIKYFAVVALELTLCPRAEYVTLFCCVSLTYWKRQIWLNTTA